jgi:hypothetical protein
MAFDAFGEGRTRRPVRCVIYTRQSAGTSDELSSCAIQREACAVFARLHVNLVIVTAPELGNAAQDHFLLNIMASFAEFEREMIAGRIAEAATGKRPSEIAGEANTNQYRTRAKGPWSARQVVATLRNPVYAGYLGNGAGIRLGGHPPIIDMDQFEGAGRALDSRRTARPKPSAYGDVWPLKGKIRCGQCGRPLSPHSCRRGNKVYRYYRCRATAGGRKPGGYLIPAWDIESMIWKRQPDVREGESLDAGRLRQLVARVVYKPDQNRVAVTWKKDPE